MLELKPHLTDRQADALWSAVAEERRAGTLTTYGSPEELVTQLSDPAGAKPRNASSLNQRGKTARKPPQQDGAQGHAPEMKLTLTERAQVAIRALDARRDAAVLAELVTLSVLVDQEPITLSCRSSV